MAKKSGFRKWVYETFSDMAMIIFAGIGLIILVIQIFGLIPQQALFLNILEALIYLAFLLEFMFKVGIDGYNYIIKNKLDSFLSMVIILSPVAGIVYGIFASAAPIRVITTVSRAVRALAYAGKPASKSIK